MKISDCPLMHSSLIIGDDPYLIAELSSLLAKKNHYLPIIDGPRLTRMDADAEIIRRNNAAARVRPKAIFLTSLSQEALAGFESRFPPKVSHIVNSTNDIRDTANRLQIKSKEKFQWDRKNIGTGLLIALRNGKEIEFIDGHVSEALVVFPDSNFLVVCEEGNDLAQVIAANYAYSIGAGLCLIPEIDDDVAERILETFYSLYSDKEKAPATIMDELVSEIRYLGKTIPNQKYDAITFITKPLPWGFAFNELPTCHQFIYPDLGISLINGISAEQPDSSGIRLAAVIDPQQFKAPEVEIVAEMLADRHVLVRGFRGPMANVNDVTKMLKLFPYDFLLITTHCGDSTGWRWTYEYTDSEKIERKLVVDLAIGVAVVPGEEKLLVNQYTRFVSLDGVDWHDKNKKNKLYIGNAINDWIDLTRDVDGLKPTSKERIDRVHGSSALKMYDDNLLVSPDVLADNETPIIFNNACSSWHQLSQTFVFGNARAYIGTLFEVTNTEAHDIAMKLLRKYFGKPLALSLWRAQNDLYGKSNRRPYLYVGTHFQKLRTIKQDNAKYLIQRLLKSEIYWEKVLGQTNTSENADRTIKNNLGYLKKEIQGMKQYLA